MTGERGAHESEHGDTGAGAAVAVAVVMVVVVVRSGGGARWGGGVRNLFRSKPPHSLSARLVAAEELDTCSNSACALEGHVDWQKGRIMAVRPACAFCRAGAAGPSKRYSDMLLDTTTPLLW